MSNNLSCKTQPETLQTLMAIWKAHFPFPFVILSNFGGVMVLCKQTKQETRTQSQKGRTTE